MKKILFLLTALIYFQADIFAAKLEKTTVILNAPWGLTWIDSNQLLITQKSGEIFLVDTNGFTQTEINHDIPSVQFGQGGLLDITSEGNKVWVTCSIKKKGKYTTAVFQGEVDGNNIINTK